MSKILDLAYDFNVVYKWIYLAGKQAP
ncbi:hypothetical protein NSND_60294 [Nitrospira sp. ND1]|nr:hypothetical protein NSND_60294 [Nitrospira sp. ND1]